MWLTLLAVLSACDSTENASIGEPAALDVPAGAVAGPRLSTRPDGGLVLSWMATANDTKTLRFARIDRGELGESRDVMSDPAMFVNWADVPSVLQVEDNHWFAHWLSYSADKTYSYDVVVAQSFDGGRSWSEPLAAHTDGTPTEHGFVSMHRAADGTSLLWLDGRNTPDAPMTLRSAVVTPSGERIREQLVDASVCDCCQTDVAVSAHGPIAVYRDRTEDEIRDIYVSHYADGAWETGTRLYADNWNIAGCPVNGPSIVADGNLVAVAWFSAANDAPVVRVAVSADGGTNFFAPVTVSSGRLAGYVDLAIIDDRTLAVSWVGRDQRGNALRLRTVSVDGSLGEIHPIADIEQVRVFPQLGYQDGNLYVFWTDTADDHSVMAGRRIPVESRNVQQD
ncbi:MAG: sialidase family protein [Woeseiaceae bacterium]|jgi:hypothetical protein